MKIRSCRFECAAFGAEDEPRGPGRDIAFLGRSNVGKSSLINRLLGTKDLAKTSSRPGRTTSANFYRVNETYWFVDLPGYGYARVPEAVRRSWGPLVEGILDRRRERIALALLVVDARHPPNRLDVVMRDWLEAKEIPYLVAATKTDKLKGNQRTRAIAALGQGLGPAEADPILVSAQTGRGIREVWSRVDEALGVEG